MSTKLQYASDLHVEFPANEKFLEIHPLQPVADTLILAGDIVPLAVMDERQEFFRYVSDHFERTFWLPGNHEYYDFDLAKKSGELYEEVFRNVFLVNNTSIVHRNVKLVFTTLWSHIGTDHERQIAARLNDFHWINHNGDRLSIERYNQLHADSLDFIKNEIGSNHGEQIVVATHHCPTFFNYPEQYKGDMLNEAFATELSDLIESSNIDYWVFGHHHNNIPEFSIGKTKLITNQLGYVAMEEHGLFERNKVIEL